MLVATLILASGCHKQSTEESPEPSQTNKPFDVAQAMRMLYGNYEEKEQASAALLPEYPGTSHSDAKEPMTVRAVFTDFNGDAGAQTFVLVTSAVPPNYGCHPCAPTIGIAVFSQKHSKWTIDASNRIATYEGSWGKPPMEIQSVQIGPNHRAVLIGDTGSGQGESTGIMELLIPWNGTVTRGLKRVVSDGYVCAEEIEGLPCYENHRTVKFIPSGKAEYYDLELELTGTDLVGGNGAPMSAQEVHGLETLKFENGKYVQVSRQGDVTSADRNVPGQ